jgi:hypothetical protein
MCIYNACVFVYIRACVCVYPSDEYVRKKKNKKKKEDRKKVHPDAFFSSFVRWDAVMGRHEGLTLDAKKGEEKERGERGSLPRERRGRDGEI